jgi:mono/diheme cytochrome c family protein
MRALIGKMAAFAIGLALASSALAQDVPAAAPEDPIKARGKYLVSAGNCISCHTRPGGVPFTGGLAFDTPFGTLYSTNITPDDETGIGTWTAADLRRALREGIAPGGRNLFPAFPYTAFAKVTDADVDAIYAYLASLKAERYTPPANSPAFGLRWPMKIWNKLFFKPGPFAEDRSQSAEWNRGAYLVEGLGHCGACHSPRNRAMAEIADRAYAGGTIQDKVGEAGPVRRWSAVNLTSAKEGLGTWPVEDLAKYLNTGLSAHAGSFGPMNEVIANSLTQLTKADAHAMAVYLKSLPAQDSKSATVSADQAKRGEGIYKERCSTCHQSSGRGGLFTGPPVAGSAVAQADDPAALINVILYGPATCKDIATGAWETMKPFKEVLSDEEVASVSNYLRGNWGNRGRPVSAGEVARQR